MWSLANQWYHYDMLIIRILSRYAVAATQSSTFFPYTPHFIWQLKSSFPTQSDHCLVRRRPHMHHHTNPLHPKHQITYTFDQITREDDARSDTVLLHSNQFQFQGGSNQQRARTSWGLKRQEANRKARCEIWSPVRAAGIGGIEPPEKPRRCRSELSPPLSRPCGLKMGRLWTQSGLPYQHSPLKLAVSVFGPLHGEMIDWMRGSIWPAPPLSFFPSSHRLPFPSPSPPSPDPGGAASAPAPPRRRFGLG